VCVCVCKRAREQALRVRVCVFLRLPGVEPRCTLGIKGRDTPQPLPRREGPAAARNYVGRRDLVYVSAVLGTTGRYRWLLSSLSEDSLAFSRCKRPRA
jgi:hypothetical protein